LLFFYLQIIANKQDLPSARSLDDIEKELGLNELANSQLWHLEAACAVTGEGLDVALESLLQLIMKRKKLGKRARNKTR
jgi:ADP-ribosylation factor-like protein 4